jgi:putative hydrolase
LFQSLPGVGSKLARDIHDKLHVDTLEELEIAAYDGLLTTIPGIGERRAAAIRAGLAVALGRGTASRRRRVPAPPVSLLLAIDIDRTACESGWMAFHGAVFEYCEGTRT